MSVKHLSVQDEDESFDKSDSVTYLSAGQFRSMGKLDI